MSEIVRKYPALCLVVLAMVLAEIPIAAVNAGVLPQGATQLGALSASLAGLILAATEGGRAGMRELLARALVWRVGIRWWAFVLLFPVIPSVAALYLFNLLGGPTVDWSTLQPLPSVIPMIVVLTVLAGFGEEFGWRGYAIPRLQERYSALTTSLIIGALWGTWHIPLFFTEGTSQHGWLLEGGWLLAVGGYTIYNMAWSVQYTWVFNNTKGSVLLAAVMHGAGNAWIGGYIDVERTHLGGVLTLTALMAIVSMVIVLMAGPSNLSRSHRKNVLGSTAPSPSVTQ
jgi:membrane protease YdiL (CAAX protease family)